MRPREGQCGQERSRHTGAGGERASTPRRRGGGGSKPRGQRVAWREAGEHSQAARAVSSPARPPPPPPPLRPPPPSPSCLQRA
eukprot:93628-Prymnesium_polylepis.1